MALTRLPLIHTCTVSYIYSVYYNFSRSSFSRTSTWTLSLGAPTHVFWNTMSNLFLALSALMFMTEVPICLAAKSLQSNLALMRAILFCLWLTLLITTYSQFTVGCRTNYTYGRHLSVTLGVEQDQVSKSKLHPYRLPNSRKRIHTPLYILSDIVLQRKVHFFQPFFSLPNGLCW